VSSSSSSDPDNIQITIWAGDLFQGLNGSSVRPGVTVDAPITRQVNKEDSRHYVKVGQALGYCTLITSFVGLLILTRM